MLKKAVVTAFEFLSVNFTGGLRKSTRSLVLAGYETEIWNPALSECDPGVRYPLGYFIGSFGPQPLYGVALCFSKSNAACGPAFCCVCVWGGGGVEEWGIMLVVSEWEN
jgi:hypothetical protein